MTDHYTAADVLPTTDTYVITYAARTGVEVYSTDTLAADAARRAYRWADRYERDPFGMFARTYRDNAMRDMREASRLHDRIIGATFGPDGADSLLTFRSYMDQADRWIGR